MPRLEACERFRDLLPRQRRELRRERLDRLPLATELEAEVGDLAAQHELRPLAMRIEDELRRIVRRVLLDQIEWNLRPLDRRARNSHTVREVAQLSRDRAVARAHARLRH